MHRTLLLDLDGTLVDTVDDMAAALNAVLSPRDLPVASRAEVRGMIGDGAAVLLARAFSARAKTVDDAALGDFLGYYTAHVAVSSRTFPHVVPTLAAMSERGWRFAVCTNKPAAAASKLLGALGLSAWCAAIGGGDSFPFRKPDPAHLLATLAAAGGVAARAVMLGDHANDVRAAAGAGVPCIFAGWGYGPIEMAAGATRVAADFSEVAGMCEQLLPERS